MKIKNILFIILFLSLNIQLNLKSQNTDNLQKLKSAIDNYNIRKVEEIIKSNSNLLQTTIDGKNLLDYALNVAEKLKLQKSKKYLEKDCLSKELSLEDEHILACLKDKVKLINAFKIIEFLEEQDIESEDINGYEFRKLEIEPLITKDEETLIEFINYLIYGPINQAIDLAVKIKKENSKILKTIEESKVYSLWEFLYLTNSGQLKKLNDEFENIDILKSILLGSICNNCNREAIEESFIWNIYKIAKEYNLKALGRSIKQMAASQLEGTPLKDVPRELKLEILKFI